MNLKITGPQTILLSDDTNIIMTEFELEKVDVKIKEAGLYVDLVLVGARAVIQAAKDNLEAVLGEAKRAQLDLSLTKVYAEADTGNGYLRSEITEGILLTDADFFHNMSRGYAKVRLQLKHKNYWEGAEVQVPLTNENGTNNVVGLTVYNTNDMTGTVPTKRVNYVKMAAASITGSIPTPPRIEMTNTYAAAWNPRLWNVWIGRAIDDATYPLTWFIDQGVTVSPNDGTETQIFLIPLSTAFLNGANGGHYRVFTKILTGSIDLKLNAGLYFALSAMQKTPEVTVGYVSTIDLGTLQIPPWLPNMRDQTEISLKIAGRRTGGFTAQLSDIFLFPANAFRQLIPRGYGIATGIRLVDDGITETVWTDGWSPAGKTGHYSGYGDPITLVPGKDQRLLFLNATDTGGTADTQTMSIKVFYRPRRLTP